MLDLPLHVGVSYFQETFSPQWVPETTAAIDAAWWLSPHFGLDARATLGLATAFEQDRMTTALGLPFLPIPIVRISAGVVF